MKIIPAIDLSQGKPVRLYQGDFNQLTEYMDDPEQLAKNYYDIGAQWLHIVDLDGAKVGTPQQLSQISKIAKQSPINIQMGGGFRTLKDILQGLNSSLQRIVIGSLAVNDPENVSAIINDFGVERIVLATDIKFIEGSPIVMTHGWQQESKLSLWDLLDQYRDFEGLSILCTDISKDGVLKGPNIELYQHGLEKFPHFNWQASGGVSSLQDIRDLAQTGVKSVIIGKALYEKKFTLQEALNCNDDVS